MDKVIFTNSRNKSLVANLYVENLTSIIILVHGFAVDKSSKGRFDYLADQFHNEGYSVMAFDFSGCGESSDDTLSLDKHIDDLNSAIKFVKSKGYLNIALLGHSLGGLISLNCFSSDISTMVLLAPLTDTVSQTWYDGFSKKEFEELSEKGYITRLRSKGIRKSISIDMKLFVDLDSVNQKNVLKDVVCPVLIIHGSADTLIPSIDSERAINYLSEDSKLSIIPDANHVFDGQMNVVSKLSVDWFLTNFKI